MAVVIAGTLLLSSLLRPAARTCLMLASAGTQASASASASASAAAAASSKAGQPATATVPGEPVGGFARGPGSACPAYPAKK
jgi:hypothetical protein